MAIKSFFIASIHAISTVDKYSSMFECNKKAQLGFVRSISIFGKSICTFGQLFFWGKKPVKNAADKINCICLSSV